MNKLNELKQMRARALGQIRELSRHAEERDLTPEEQTQIDDLQATVQGFEGRIAALEKLAKIDQDTEQNSRTTGRNGEPIEGRDLPHNDQRNTRNGRHGYSVLKALRESDPGAKGVALSGLELEVHQELAQRRNGMARAVGGVLMPWDLPVNTEIARRYASRQGIQRRDLTTTTGAGAVMTTTMPTMIELLRNTAVMAALGARVMADMQGNFTLPRQNTAAQGYWIAPESSTVTKSNQTIGNVSFSPNTLGTQSVYSRSFLHQTSVDAEQFIREDLSLVMALELDRAGLNGSGSGAEPTGIANNGSVGSVIMGANGGAPTWALVTGLEKAVETANALNGTLAYVTSPAGRYKLKNTVKLGNTAGLTLWDDKGEVNSHQAISSNQIPANISKGTGSNLTYLIFGDFTQAVFAFWSGLDVIVNPFTSATNGAVEITMLQDADFDLRQPKAFAVCKDMDPA